MIIVMNNNVNETDIKHVVDKINSLGYQDHIIRGTDRTVIAAIGDERGKSALNMLRSFHGVEDVMPILKPYKLVSKEAGAVPKTIEIDDVKIGAGYFTVMAGPCSVESEQQIIETAVAVKKAGANILRGGAFKPRSSPYSFQGLEEDGLKFLKKAKDETGLLIVTEVITPTDVTLVAKIHPNYFL